MKYSLRIIAILALTGTIIPSFLVFYNQLELETCKSIMTLSAVLWLLAGPSLMNRLTQDS